MSLQLDREFLAKILPATGFVCVAKQMDVGWHHFWHKDLDSAIRRMEALDNGGHTVYIAQARFLTPENRKQENAQAVRAFWLDIDCGEGKPYATQRDGATALGDFVRATGLPAPALINSGNGLYAYWPLDWEVIVSQWKGAARLFKQITAAYGLHADPTRTADASSVLRPVGATHRKDPTNPKTVTLVKDTTPISFADFTAQLSALASKQKIDTNVCAAPPKQELNAEFMIGLEGPPSSAELIAQKCAVVGHVKATQGNVPEPLWYAVIGVMRHCSEGNDLIHEWSKGHPDYSHADTERKIAQHKVPPTTCAGLAAADPSLCTGCNHKGRIKTPMVLGRVLQHKELEEDRCPVPSGFVLTEQGIFTADNELVYPYDIYPTKLAYDVSLGYETMTLRHRTPHAGWQEATVRTALLHDPKALLMALLDNHIQITGKEEKKYMQRFLEDYAAKLRDRKKVAVLHNQMGWQADPQSDALVFVLGEKLYQKGVEPQQIGLARSVPQAVTSFTEQGDFTNWLETTRMFAEPKTEAHYFAFCAGAFGAPLLRFTGFAGALVACVGESGIGKTLVANWIQSVYGEPRGLVLQQDDTKNFLVGRLGLYGSLPITIDEVSNIAGGDLSDLAYRITQGRDKGRLTRGGVERQNINQWNTIAVVSSNHSLIERLSGVKGDASAEMNRIIELPFSKVPAFNREAATDVWHTVHANYGHAGARFIQYLVDHQDEHTAQMAEITKKLEAKIGQAVGERFWLAVGAAALYGASIAYKLGITLAPPARLTDYVVKALRHAKGEKEALADTPAVGILGEFLAQYAMNGIVMGDAKSPVTTRDPRGVIVFRYEANSGKLLVSASFLRSWLLEKHYSISKFKYDLTEEKILTTDNVKTNLVQGIAGFVGSRQNCWELKGNNPLLGNVTLELVRTAEAVSRMQEGL